MNKAKALSIFGGPAKTAEAVGVDTSAVSQWPDELPPRLADRIIAAVARKESPALVRRVEKVAGKAIKRSKVSA